MIRSCKFYCDYWLVYYRFSLHIRVYLIEFITQTLAFSSSWRLARCVWGRQNIIWVVWDEFQHVVAHKSQQFLFILYIVLIIMHKIMKSPKKKLHFKKSRCVNHNNPKSRKVKKVQLMSKCEIKTRALTFKSQHNFLQCLLFWYIQHSDAIQQKKDHFKSKCSLFKQNAWLFVKTRD